MKSFGKVCAIHPELRGERNGTNCAGCQKEYLAQWQRENREKSRAYNKACYEKNKAKIAARRKANPQILDEWRAKNPERVKEHGRRYRAKHRDKVFAAAKQSYIKRYRLIGGQGIANKYGVEIKAIYNACPSGHHVDHIVPLRGQGVCGLHVPWNLQYLPALQNKSKGNRWQA